MSKNKYFNWRWDDEPATSEFQLVIERKNSYGKYEYRNGQFVQIDHDGKEYFQEEKYFLKDRFIIWYGFADSTNIRPFLEHNLKSTGLDHKYYLYFLEDTMQAMINHNDFELNFEGKRQIGLNWCDKKLVEYNPNFHVTKTGNHKKEKLNFDNIFIKAFIICNRLLEKLQYNGYIDSNLKWNRKKCDFKGLVHFLIINNWVRTIKYKTLQDILLSHIHTPWEKPPDRPADAPGEKAIQQYKFLKE